MKSQYADKRGFSLIELLVVIAVIALLMGIILPALALARSSAKAIVCRSNVRQLVLANISYAQENDGFYAAAASDMWDDAGLHRWHGMREQLDEPFEPNGAPLTAYLGDGQVKECPEKIDFVEGERWDANFEQGCGGYGYNMLYIGSRLWQSGLNDPRTWRKAYARTTCTTEVRTPAATLMFADTAMSNDDGTYIEYSFAEPPFSVCNGEVLQSFYMSPSIHFRHNARANTGWADGHVGEAGMAERSGENVYGVDASKVNLGWFEPVDNSLFDLR